MDPIPHVTIRARRLFVSGGSALTPNAALLWVELGKLLAAEESLTIITGGLDYLLASPQVPSADRAIVDGFLEGLRTRGTSSRDRIETFLPDPKLDWSELKRFEIGRVHILSNRNSQSRRFRMVHSGDVLISIEGSNGTRSVLDVALAIEKTILPLPFGGGKSREVWIEERAEICRRFHITDSEAAEFEAIDLASLSEPDIVALAQRVCACLLRGFTRSCFVIMPFSKEAESVYEDAICPALAAHGLHPLRTDKHVLSGNILAAIREGLRNCYLAIADTTDDRPNVMYELGMAHAHDKAVILLRHLEADGKFSQPPFDLQTDTILAYTDDMTDLRRRLETAIAFARNVALDSDG